MKPRLALAAAIALTLTSLTAWLPAPAAHAASISPPVHHGTLRVSGTPRDGATVAAAGLRWHAPRLPRGMSLLSFEVAYSWQSCDAAGTHCRAGADSTAAPFAARHYAVGHADTGRRLRLTETASEVVQTKRNPFTFQVIRRSVSALTAAAVRAYPRHHPPVIAFVNGTPERRTASAEEYFQVAAPHANAADGAVSQSYRIDVGSWRAMPKNRVFYTGTLVPGPHQVAVRTASRAGATEITFGWQIDPPTPPLPCQGQCWYPPHLDRTGHPMRWDWQIGRTTPLQRTGRNAVDITCTALSGATPCGWDDFTAAGQWVGEAEYAEDGYVCSPGQKCKGPHSFGTFCRSVSSVPHGYAAVRFDVDLDGKIFYPCRE